MKDNSAKEIAKVILPQFPEISLSDLETIVDNYKKYDSWYNNPIIKEDDYKALEDIMIRANLLDEYVPFDKLVSNLYNE